MGHTDINAKEKAALVKSHGGKNNDWLTEKSDDYIRDHIENMIAYSRTIKNE